MVLGARLLHSNHVPPVVCFEHLRILNFRAAFTDRILLWVKYGFVTVGGQIENRVKYGFVTVMYTREIRRMKCSKFVCNCWFVMKMRAYQHMEYGPGHGDAAVT
jgi:hypothetical protein